MSPPAGAARPVRETALAAVFFLAVTVMMTWPQAAHLNDALSDVGDAKLNARILEWDFHQTLHDPARLYQLNFFHPARYVLAFSENLWGISVLGFPLLAAGASPLLNYNALLLAGMFLSALSAWALAREVTGDPIASVVSGLVFAFVPWRFSQLPHLQFQWAGFLALSLLFLLRYLERGRRRDAVLFGVALAWNALCNVHYAVFSGILVSITLAVDAAQRRSDRSARLRGALLASFAAALAFLPFALPYRRVQELYGMKRYMGEMLVFSGRWLDFLSAGAKNRLYGALTARFVVPEGDFFPGLAAVALAVAAVVMLRRRPLGADPEPLSERRLRAARVFDLLAVPTAAIWLLAVARPGLRLGPIGVGDPGRVQVWLTVFVLVRLSLAFPRGWRYADLGDWIRRGPLPPRLTLLLVLAVVGVLVARGGQMPYYRFLFQSFGQVFRAIRAPARGIVLFHLALAVLGAWGLAQWLRGRSTRRRLAWTAAAVTVLLVEYRAFPLDMVPTAAEAPPVYRWLSTLDLPAAVVEFPLGILYDFDYVFRQAQHEKPLVNGYSGFFPTAYTDLVLDLRRDPIPDTVWSRLGALGTGVLVYHAHDGRGFRVIRYADAISRYLESGGIELVRRFPHEDGEDFVFIGAGTTWRARVAEDPEAAAETRRRFEESVRRLHEAVARLAPPFGVVHRPEEGETVVAGYWAHGWAADDSGIAEIRLATELGPAGAAALLGPWPGLAEAFPEYPDLRTRGGFGIAVPDLPQGPHTLIFTLVAKDGGRSTLERHITVARALPASPKPTGPGNRRTPGSGASGD